MSRGRPSVYSSGRLSCSLRVRTQAPCPECRVSQRGLRRAGRRPRAGRAVLAAVGPQRQIRRQHKLSDRTTFPALEAGHRWPRVRDSGGDRLPREGTDRRTNHRLPGLSGTEVTSCPPICETRERPRQAFSGFRGQGRAVGGGVAIPSLKRPLRLPPGEQPRSLVASVKAAENSRRPRRAGPLSPIGAVPPSDPRSALRRSLLARPPPRSTLSPGSAMRSSPHGGTAWPERFPRWS